MKFINKSSLLTTLFLIPLMLISCGEQVDEEGCLSVIGESGLVRRPQYVKVRALNRYGKEIILEGTELLARAFCHEIDHLEGVLFTDKIEKK